MYVMYSIRVNYFFIVFPTPHNGSNSTWDIMLATNSGYCLRCTGRPKGLIHILIIADVGFAELSAITSGTATFSKSIRYDDITFLSTLKTVQNALLRLWNCCPLLDCLQMCWTWWATLHGQLTYDRSSKGRKNIL